jgi:hypothetical protein
MAFATCKPLHQQYQKKSEQVFTHNFHFGFNYIFFTTFGLVAMKYSVLAAISGILLHSCLDQH